MRQFLLILVCLLMAFPCVALAGDTMVADAQYGVKYNSQGRVITLPQDQGKWYVSLFGNKADPKYQMLQSWFKTHAGLKSLRSQVHFNEYSPDQLRFKRYAPNMPALPFVRVQTAKGVVVSEFSAQHIPISPEALYSGIRVDLTDPTSGFLFRRRSPCRPGPQPDWRRPCPKPPVTPPVPPVTPPSPPIGPPVLPPVEPIEPDSESHDPTWWLSILSSLVGAGIGLAQGWKDVYAPENG